MPRDTRVAWGSAGDVIRWKSGRISLPRNTIRAIPMASRDRMYVVYRVTPDMWEWPWITQLLGDLPISRYCGLGIRTRPVAHPRLRRLSRTVQPFFPGSLRPTRRLWRKLDLHDFSIYVYNTWALDYQVVSELSDLLSRFHHIGIVSIDESTQDSQEIYDRVTFAVRIGFNSEKYERAQNLLVAPLGVPKHFVHPDCPKEILDREFAWSFLGEVKNPNRRNMVAQMERVKGKNFVHTITTWDAEDSLRGTEYSNILANSVFVPSPSANVHCECYRTYEALECRAIPVVDTDYYRETFGAPFPVAKPAWEDAPDILNRWLDNPDSLEDLHRECQAWWEGVKTGHPRKVSLLAEPGQRPATRQACGRGTEWILP
jgi:hypothetical protein